MPKLTVVKSARKPQGECGKCGGEINQGDPYRHWTVGFRGAKAVRCMKPECTPRQSEMDSSKMGEVYAAQEDAESALAAAATIDDIKTALEDCGGRGRDVANEYEEAIEAMPALEDTTRDRIDALETWADDLEGFDPEIYVDKDGLPSDDEDAVIDDDVLDTIKDAAREVVNSLEA